MTAPEETDLPPPPGAVADGTMGILDHLRELRKAILYSLLSIAVLTAATLYFAGDIFRVLTMPLLDVYNQIGHDQKLIFTSPPEGLLTYMKVGLFSGFLAATPFWMYFLGRFVWVALYPTEKKFLLSFVGVGSFLFVIGGAFGYFEVFPAGLAFMIANYRGETLEALITINEYFSFAVALIVAFGAAFQLPLLMFLLGRLGLITARQLVRWFRWAVLAIFIVAAVLTPPDVVSQMLLALPLILLYFSGVLAVWLFGKRKPAAEPPNETAGGDERPPAG